ncbi:hypothetical protein B0H66DRAFT_535208 [Apodospora peruviana]|uniref:Uncharacterized protein n=1 Tax=Apodospora peruviana TaxID=516989 RepID=A0AAE0M2S8_9PEZI|nr:hypothetical protein B0H66DRAFT_535208 [Apodospora peruviana]
MPRLMALPVAEAAERDMGQFGGSSGSASDALLGQGQPWNLLRTQLPSTLAHLFSIFSSIIVSLSRKKRLDDASLLWTGLPLLAPCIPLTERSGWTSADGHSRYSTPENFKSLRRTPQLSVFNIPEDTQPATNILGWLQLEIEQELWLQVDTMAYQDSGKQPQILCPPTWVLGPSRKASQPPPPNCFVCQTSANSQQQTSLLPLFQNWRPLVANTEKESESGGQNLTAPAGYVPPRAGMTMAQMDP